MHKLIGRADLVHNFRPGVPERLGIDYETAQQLHPRLIYAYGASYGSTGPHAHRPAMHPIPGTIGGGAPFTRDPRFGGQSLRIQHSDELIRILEPHFLQRTVEDWAERDVSCVKIHEGEMGEFLDREPLLREAGLWQEVFHRGVHGPYWRHGPAWTFSRTPGTVGPMTYLGEHTRSILRELGYDDGTIEGWNSARIVTWPEDS